MRKNYFHQCTAFATQFFSKLFLLTAALIFFTHFTSLATTYTFNGSTDNDWTTGSNWDSYPGTTISVGDEVIIEVSSSCNIPIGITVEINGILTNNGSLNIDGVMLNNGNITNTILNFISTGGTGAFTINNSSTFTNYGFFSSNGSVTINNGGTIVNENSFTYGFGGGIAINGTFINNSELGGDGNINNAGILINNGHIQEDADSPSSGTGIIMGKGTFDTTHETSFKNSGMLKPDTVMTFNYNFTNIGTIELDLGHPDSSDKINVVNIGFPIDSSGTAKLGGTLVVNLKSGYTGHDNVIILTADNLVGTFSSVTLPSNWFINYNKPSTGKVTLSYGALLPVELLSFKAIPLSNSVKLSWQTADEINNKGFQIEKRKSWGEEWESIGFVDAKGNSSTYEFTDDSPLSINYYRLRQMDNDGQNTLSKVVSAALNSTKALKIYPSIVYDNVLNIENDKIDNMPYSIFNMLGQPLKAGNATTQIDISTLPNGAYILKIGADKAKFVKE